MMKTNSVVRRIRRRRGQGMTEYIIIVGLIAILLVGAVKAFKGALEKAYQGATTKVDTEITQQINAAGPAPPPGGGGT